MPVYYAGLVGLTKLAKIIYSKFISENSETRPGLFCSADRAELNLPRLCIFIYKRILQVPEYFLLKTLNGRGIQNLPAQRITIDGAKTEQLFISKENIPNRFPRPRKALTNF